VKWLEQGLLCTFYSFVNWSLERNGFLIFRQKLLLIFFLICFFGYNTASPKDLLFTIVIKIISKVFILYSPTQEYVKTSYPSWQYDIQCHNCVQIFSRSYLQAPFSTHLSYCLVSICYSWDITFLYNFPCTKHFSFWFVCLLVFVFWGSVLLCNIRWPQTCDPLPSAFECWNYRESCLAFRSSFHALSHWVPVTTLSF
jgi:hypothetical protein